MRLLLLNYEFPPIGGGAGTASYNLALEYARQGHSVDVLTCRVSGQPSVEHIHGVCVYRVMSVRKGPHEVGLYGTVTYLCAAYISLRKLLRSRRYDYAQFFFAMPTGLLSFYWRRITDIPYIVSLRGSDVPGYDQDHKFVGHLHRVLLPVTRNILANAEHVVANSQSLRRLALNSFPDIPISVITNGVSESKFTPASSNRNTDQTINALCVARLVGRKGINLLLQAIKNSDISSLKVRIAGDGPKKQTLYDLADELGIEDRVEFLGQQSSKALAEWYRTADFLVHPAIAESFSMTLLEAMASGLPVIAANVGGIPELVVDGVNGILYSPANVSALSSALADMCSDADQRAKYAKNNRAKILSSFTWAHIGEQYLQQCFANSALDADTVHTSTPCD